MSNSNGNDERNEFKNEPGDEQRCLGVQTGLVVLFETRLGHR